ncbi:sensor histidine kinase [Actinomadura sp. NAK00032]|uniref:sensor histidine kinase n=1 Tax=Actinomadura sp. NAK00032 TaxID=2742128 RepID=UPI0015916475|nr:ATP-binding protein [Actinomadura sp. NAK00032]QKW39140.1 sensor histidine kinase [Actinomadura sp. NAK00032]
MPVFSEPAAEAERQDFRRHGRPPTRGTRRQSSARSFHLCISVLPAAVIGILGVAAAAVLYNGEHVTQRAQIVLAAAAVAAVLTLGAAVFGADAATRRFERQPARQPERVQGQSPEDVQRRLGELWFSIARGRQGLQELAERVKTGETAPRSEDVPAIESGDAFVRLAYELRQAQGEAWNAVLDVAASRAPSGGESTDQRVDVFVNLARRMQSLAHRAIKGLDELENQVEDPDLLKGLFRVDHLSTRMRRQAESLAVIGGAASRRQWSRPVTVYEVLRSAIAEVEHYNRVKVVPPVEGTLHGSAVADVVHLLAELIENATRFAPPHTQVLVRVDTVTAGLAVEVEDRGLGIPRESQRRLNDLLADPDRGGAEELLQEGRIGLLVVSALARRHGVRVELRDNLYGGVQATVVVPMELVGAEQEETEAVPQAQPAHAEPVPVPAGAPVAAAAAPRAAVPASAYPSASESYAPADRYAPADAPGRHANSAPAANSGPAANPGAPADSGVVDNAERPSLPRRRVQANMAPELVNPPAPQHQQDDTEVAHNPGLMAAFQRGVRGAEESDGVADGTDGTD